MKSWPNIKKYEMLFRDLAQKMNLNRNIEHLDGNSVLWLSPWYSIQKKLYNTDRANRASLNICWMFAVCPSIRFPTVIRIMSPAQPPQETLMWCFKNDVILEKLFIPTNYMLLLFNNSSWPLISLSLWIHYPFHVQWTVVMGHGILLKKKDIS